MTAILLLASALVGQAESELRIRPLDKAGSVEVVAALPTALHEKLPVGRLAPEVGEAWLRLTLVDPHSKLAGPAMLGTYERTGDNLVFRPRFTLEAGRHYRATSGPVAKPVHSADYHVPAPPPAEPAQVVKIYPTADLLPANHLRFYIVFSRGMRGGPEIFKQIALLDEDGKEVNEPWLADEIWDEDECCLILYIHPGRIKWGVELREALGPVLLPEKRYTLIVRGEMRDADGRRLGKDYKKSFRTTAEERTRFDPGAWTLSTPAAGSRDSLVLRAGRSVDRRSVGRLQMQDGQGQPVAGTFSLDEGERAVSFRPTQPWPNAECQLVVSDQLQDSAGNTPRRPFDADLNAAVLPPPRLRLTFRPAAR